MIAILLFWGLKNGHAQQINDSWKTDEIWQILDSIAKTNDIKTTPDSVNKQENPQPKKKPLIEEKSYELSLPDPRGWKAERIIYYNDSADFQDNINRIKKEIAKRDTLHQIYEAELEKLKKEDEENKYEKSLYNTAIMYLNHTSNCFGMSNQQFLDYIQSREFTDIATLQKITNDLKNIYHLTPEEIRQVELPIMIHLICIEIQNCYRHFRNIAMNMNNKIKWRSNYTLKFQKQISTHMLWGIAWRSYLNTNNFLQAIKRYLDAPNNQKRRIVEYEYDKRIIKMLTCQKELCLLVDL